MKLLRVLLLVLLAGVLPVRGAMAATMLCMPAGGSTHAETRVGDASHHDHASHAEAGQVHEQTQHDHGKSIPTHDHASHDKCNVCSSTCSSPPLPSATAGIEGPQVLTAVSFPDLSAPAPTYESDGQERPPRTI